MSLHDTQIALQSGYSFKREFQWNPILSVYSGVTDRMIDMEVGHNRDSGDSWMGVEKAKKGSVWLGCRVCVRENT